MPYWPFPSRFLNAKPWSPPERGAACEGQDGTEQTEKCADWVWLNTANKAIAHTRPYQMLQQTEQRCEEGKEGDWPPRKMSHQVPYRLRCIRLGALGA